MDFLFNTPFRDNVYCVDSRLFGYMGLSWEKHCLSE